MTDEEYIKSAVEVFEGLARQLAAESTYTSGAELFFSTFKYADGLKNLAD